MKDAEDEAFDELAKRQGHWGGGYQAKRQMAADKLQEPAQEQWNAALDEVAARIGEIKGFGQATQDSFAVFIKGLKK
jgi:hypothetical protein